MPKRGFVVLALPFQNLYLNAGADEATYRCALRGLVEYMYGPSSIGGRCTRNPFPIFPLSTVSLIR